jgi:Na+/proline symporter
LRAIETRFDAAHNEQRAKIHDWLAARHGADPEPAKAAMLAAHQRTEALRTEARQALAAADPIAQKNDADYVFITFVLEQMPHGIIGLLIALVFAAAVSSLSSELAALGETTTIDLYRHVLRSDASDLHYVRVSKGLTAFWGLIAIGFALFAHLAENLIQAVNILGSIFYGVVLGLFLVAFFLRRIGGTAAFWGAVAAQALVFALYFSLNISYLWYNFIGCAACILFSLILQSAIGSRGATAQP